MKFRFRRYYLYYLGRCLAFVFYLIPLRVGLLIACFLGRIAFLVLTEYRRVALDNLKSAFGKNKTDAEIRLIARRVFENLARNAVELVNFPKINRSNIDDFIEIKNRGRLDDALKNGAGAIVLTGHFGNWELLAGTLRLKGYPGAAIGRKIYFDKYDKYLNYLRKTHDVNIIYRDQSPRNVLRILRDNAVIGVLADQDVDSVDGVFVNFFGMPAYTPVGPAMLSRASGAPLMPCFLVRNNGKHRLMVEEPIELVDTGNRDADLVTNTQKWSDVIESYIRRYPEQWVWVHRRWKTKPFDKSSGLRPEQSRRTKQAG